jgi:hypothetical protein
MLASPGDKEAQKQALKAANAGWDKAPTSITPVPSAPSGGGFGANVGFSTPSGFGMSGSFNAPAPWASSVVATSSTGKPMPEQPQQPEL